MTSKEIIRLILDANHPIQIFPNYIDWKSTYLEYIKLIHPDVSNDNNAKQATARLNQFKHDFEVGCRHNDDAGIVTYTPTHVEILGNKELLKKSLCNYQYLMSLTDVVSIHFKQYLPKSAKLLSDNELQFELHNRAIPLSSLGSPIEHKHVKWILNRMLEFSVWLQSNNICHAGINPDSIYVIPENHGMQCISFYHMSKTIRLYTISSKYSKFYPNSVFLTKEVSKSIDLILAKKTAIYLLGDKSGIGNILRKSINSEFLYLLQTIDSTSLEAYTNLRKHIKKTSDGNTFHPLIA